MANEVKCTPSAPDNASIANRLRSVLLMLDRPPVSLVRTARAPLDVVRGIVDELDAWEEHLENRRNEPPIGSSSKKEVRRHGR